jgi:adenosylcobinamide-phosphate synthase
VTPAEPTILLTAILLDLILGDPRWLPHPVVFIGRLISVLDGWLYRTIPAKKTAGIVLLTGTVLTAGVVAWGMIRIGTSLHPLAGFFVAAILAYTCLALRSLHRESALVASALSTGDINAARHLLSRIVGRDTEHLDEGEIWRALVETVAENTCDGIIAPLFWLTLTGPVGAVCFKAVSTLDSMVGYRNDRYRQFGWASARMDDLLNFVPARFTALLMILAAPLCGLSLPGALMIARRDRRKHPSPNSGHPEAAAAGALGVRLGGTSHYQGRISHKEFIGDPVVPLDQRAYAGMIRLMYTTTLLMAAISAAAAYTLGGYHVPHL